jgi:glycosyltransferase involved in cell wall biosynthesis
MDHTHYKIIQLITSTDIGGAEIALLNFLQNSGQQTIDYQVISLTPTGIIGEKIASSGIPVHSLNLSPGLSGIISLPRLAAMIRKTSTALVHCWMYHANLFGGLASSLAGIPCVWSIRHNDLNPALLKKSTILVAKLGARFSRHLPERIIYCSDSAQSIHQRIGYDGSKGIFIPNGFDTSKFFPNREAGRQARKQFSIPPNACVIGHVGRFHPTKDHLTFLRAARILQETQPTLVFVLCGSQVDDNNNQLRSWVEELGLTQHVCLIGQQEDMPPIYNMMDIFISSSLSEAFPNVIGEAMSCGLACVATDTGDSSLIIGDPAMMVPCGNPEYLASVIITYLGDQDKRSTTGQANRMRIQELFSISTMVKTTERLYVEILGKE